MSLSAKYQAFLGNPSAAALAEHASLHYITTLTTLNDPAAILKHFTVQDKLLKKKSEKVLSVIESGQNLCLDVEIEIEFVSGGGAFLPGLDDNFVSDRVVSFPMIHIVHFDADQNISQIRLYWDQGSLLKQIDVIGARARNWPIRDGKDQARLIAMSAGAVSQPPSVASSRRSTTASQGSDQVVITERPGISSSHARGSRHPRGDPHSTLALFEPRDVNQENSYSKPTSGRGQSAKPAPRELSELFVGEEGNPSAETNEPSSPQKQSIPIKSGGGKNFRPNRLFDDTEEEVKPPMSVKTNSKKYDHFEFADGEDESTPKVRETARPTSKKHQSQWDFEDFVTPQKIKPKIHAQAQRHFGWSDDEVETSPVRHQVVHKQRPDQTTHFEFKDDGTPIAEKPANAKGKLHNKGLGLYQDHVLNQTSDNEDTEGNAYSGDSKRPVGHTTNSKNRKKDFGSQWEMTDTDPNPEALNGNGNSKNKINDGQKKVLKSLDAHWGLYESPDQSKKENTGIKTAGNGMGARKGTESHWSIGDEDDAYAAPPAKKIQPTSAENKENTGIKTAGNGMGGRKGTESHWSIGDEDEAYTPAPKKKNQPAAAGNKDFWEF